MSNYKIVVYKNSDFEDIYDKIYKILENVLIRYPEYFFETLNAFQRGLDKIESLYGGTFISSGQKYLKKIYFENSRKKRLPYIMVVVYSRKEKIVYPITVFHEKMDIHYSSINIPDEIDKNTLVEQKDLKFFDFLLMNWN